jgi:hypothetical protein
LSLLAVTRHAEQIVLGVHLEDGLRRFAQVGGPVGT